METTKIQKILESYRRIKEEAMSSGGMTTQSSAGKAGFSGSADAQGPVAGYDGTVDFRKKKYKKLNMFYRQAVKPTKGAKNGKSRD